MAEKKRIIIAGEEETTRENTNTIRESLNLIGISQIGLFTLAALYALIHSKPVLLPLVLSLLLAMVLRPAHRALGSLKIPPPFAAAIVVFCLVAVGFSAGNKLAEPAAEWIDTIDMQSAESKLMEVFAPIQEMQQELEEVVDRVDKITERKSDVEDDDEKSSLPLDDSTTQEVSMENGDESEIKLKTEGDAPVTVEISKKPVSAVLDYVQDFGVHALATLLLIFFFLGFGETMHRRLSEDDATAELIKNVSTEVSAYLFTISAINAGLGICIAVSMWLLGMPNPVLWGVMGALLNFIPYLGAIAGSVVVFLVAIVSANPPSLVFMVPAVYFLLTAIEGNVITPMIIGKRFTLNPIVVALWFMTWGALWGVPGMLIATPTLMAFKIICSKVPTLDRIDRVISV